MDQYKVMWEINYLSMKNHKTPKAFIFWLYSYKKNDEHGRIHFLGIFEEKSSILSGLKIAATTKVIEQKGHEGLCLEASFDLSDRMSQFSDIRKITEKTHGQISC